MQSDFQIHCAGCGALVSYQSAWRESLSKVQVCGQDCNDKVKSAYCQTLLGERGAFDILVNGEKHSVTSMTVSYDDVCMMVCGKVVKALTIMYDKALGDKTQGTLITGQTVFVQPGTRIEAMFTGNA